VGPGGRIVFTSLRQGDLDLYTMDADGRNVRRLTDEPGYDGGAFYSWDGRMIVFRAHRPKTREDIDEYRALLARSLVRPRALELYVMRADGTGLRQVTRNGAANFAPFLHPNGQHIVFASNLHDPGGRSFALYLVNVDGVAFYRRLAEKRPDLLRRLVFISGRPSSEIKALLPGQPLRIVEKPVPVRVITALVEEWRTWS